VRLLEFLDTALQRKGRQEAEGGGVRVFYSPGEGRKDRYILFDPSEKKPGIWLFGVHSSCLGGEKAKLG